jgi:hypothetical protein
MTKNLKKIVRKIYLNAKEADVTKRTFNPNMYPVNWAGAIKALNLKDKRLAFNAIFKPLFVEIYATDIKAYLTGGHKLTGKLKKAIKDNAKQKAKEITQDQITARAAASQQSQKEQENVLPEG